MKSPQGLLEGAATVELSVFAATKAKCLTTGHVTQIPAGEDTQKFTLQHDCDPGVAWCKDIELDKDGTDKFFAVVASDANGAVIAEGCATAKIDQDPLEVGITVERFNPPGCCNDGKIQAGEQCDPGVPAATDCVGEAGGQCRGITADAVCECDCLAHEIAIDRVADPAPPPQTKVGLSLAFCPGGGELDKALRAAFTNATAPTNNDVMIRDLQSDLYPIDNPVGLAGPLHIPLMCANPSAAGSTSNQKEPSIAPVSQTSTAVVYLNDEAVGGLFEVFLSHQTDSGCADVPPKKVNFTKKISSKPDVAGGAPEFGLVVWTTKDSEVLGRIWKATTDELEPQMADIPIATSATAARVAGSPKSWAVVYQGSGPDDGDGIFLRHVDPTGMVSAPVKVNDITDGAQDQPDVAMLPDGRAMVVWHSGGDVYFQRFAANGKPIAGDQASPIHSDTAGQQSAPAVAAPADVGDFFVAAWENSDVGTISARYVGGTSGFLFNTVTGQNDDFVASHPNLAGVRRAPAVAVGGGGFVVIGWQEDAMDRSGLYVRRFPLPL